MIIPTFRSSSFRSNCATVQRDGHFSYPGTAETLFIINSAAHELTSAIPLRFTQPPYALILVRALSSTTRPRFVEIPCSIRLYYKLLSSLDSTDSEIDLALTGTDKQKQGERGRGAGNARNLLLFSVLSRFVRKNGLINFDSNFIDLYIVFTSLAFIADFSIFSRGEHLFYYSSPLFFTPVNSSIKTFILIQLIVTYQ